MPAVNDFQIAREWQRQFLPAVAFLTSNSTTLKAGLANDGITPLAFADVNSRGIPAVTVSTDNDHVHVMWVPPSLDSAKKVYFRVWWTSTSTTDADNSVWAITTNTKSSGMQITFSNMTPTTPTTVTDTIGTAGNYSYLITDAVAVAANTINRGDFLEIKVNLNSATASVVKFLGLEVLYYPNFAARGGTRPAAALPADWIVAS